MKNLPVPPDLEDLTDPRFRRKGAALDEEVHFITLNSEDDYFDSERPEYHFLPGSSRSKGRSPTKLMSHTDQNWHKIDRVIPFASAYESSRQNKK